MSESEDQRAQRASAASESEIALYVQDPSSKVIKALLENRSLSEEHILIIAHRKTLPSDVFDAIFRDKRWAESYPVRLALARNPKTPLFTALAICRFLRLFDLAELARNHLLPVLYRKKVEAIVIEKIPTLALGIKKTLAKVSSGEILLALIQDGYPEVVRQCLENPHLIEAHLYRVISRKTTMPATIRTIADHKNWTCRYHIKFALLRNEHTPLSRSVFFLPDIKTADLRELYRDPHLPSGIRPSLHRELLERGEDPRMFAISEEDPIYEIEENEMEELDREMRGFETQRGNGLRKTPGPEHEEKDALPEDPD
jgi:hypothetical protein